MQRRSGGGLAAFLILIGGLVLAAGNVAVFVRAGHGVVSVETVRAAVYECSWCLAFLGGAPVLAGVALAFWGARRSRKTLAAIGAAAVPAAAPPSPDAALRLLALLQQEGRLVDFLQEDISIYDDAQVGAAVRSIHGGCRKVLSERITLERVIDEEDGAEVEVEAGFDPSAIRVTGNVVGTPPFHGSLQHAGWRAVKTELPLATSDPTIIAPAEVEVP